MDEHIHTSLLDFSCKCDIEKEKNEYYAIIADRLTKGASFTTVSFWYKLL